jgi:hypothetical protein
MTERKPPDMSFTSWIDRQINEAKERGAFDDLPGTGKPLPKWPEADDGQAWLRDYLRREGISAEELLPTPLRLRKQIERLTETVQDLRSEQEVRDVAADLNRQIVQWRRIPEGPPVPLRLVDTERLVSRWRAAHAPPPPAGPEPANAQARRPQSPRWWRRLRKRAQGRPGNSPGAGLRSARLTCPAARRPGQRAVLQPQDQHVLRGRQEGHGRTHRRGEDARRPILAGTRVPPAPSSVAYRGQGATRPERRRSSSGVCGPQAPSIGARVPRAPNVRWYHP